MYNRHMKTIEVINMMIGSCSIEIIMHEPNSLKEKRHIIKSLVGRLQSRFNISVAEVDMHDKWRHGVIGFACVSTTKKHANQMINKVIDFIEGDTRVEVVKFDIEIL